MRDKTSVPVVFNHGGAERSGTWVAERRGSLFAIVKPFEYGSAITYVFPWLEVTAATEQNPLRIPS